MHVDQNLPGVILGRRGEVVEGLRESDVWRAKRLYDSAYHPDTGEKMFIVGRMSFQVRQCNLQLCVYYMYVCAGVW